MPREITKKHNLDNDKMKQNSVNSLHHLIIDVNYTLDLDILF